MKHLLFIAIISSFTILGCKPKEVLPASVEKPEPELVETGKIEKEERFKTDIGAKVPDFSFKARDWKKYSMKKFKGKIVWLNFFATWCGPCLVEIPELNKLHEKHPDVVFISLARGQTIEELIPFAKEKKMEYIVGADPDKEVFTLFADKFIPRNYLIDKKGIIRQQEIGFDEEAFAHFVSDLEKIMD